MPVTSTRSGRVIRKPVNEYTERTYVSGSGRKGCDTYDRQFNGPMGSGTFELIYNEKLTEEDKNFIVDDGDEYESSDCESEYEDEAEFTDDEDE